jgi:hypothetical protein
MASFGAGNDTIALSASSPGVVEVETTEVATVTKTVLGSTSVQRCHSKAIRCERQRAALGGSERGRRKGSMLQLRTIGRGTRERFS